MQCYFRVFCVYFKLFILRTMPVNYFGMKKLLILAFHKMKCFVFDINNFINVIRFQEKDASSRKGIARRSTSLRQSRSPRISLELQVPSLQSPLISSLATATTTTPKKSNWEVIEHFNNAEKGRGSVSSSLIAVSFTFERTSRHASFCRHAIRFKT